MVHERRAARGVVLTPQNEVLLMKFRFPWRDEFIWITPGGSLHEGESAQQALIRELHEETGLVVTEVGAEIWRRDHQLEFEGRQILQRERYFLLRRERFEPHAGGLQQGYEQQWFRGFRWWPIGELPDHGEQFAPRRLGALVRDLCDGDLPGTPLEIPV